LINKLKVCSQILNLAVIELDVMIAKSVADGLLILSRKLQHWGIKVHADHFAFSPDDLRDDVAGFTAAGAKVENDLALFDVTRRIPTAVIPLNDFIRDDL
jgi:hypothetical protein